MLCGSDPLEWPCPLRPLASAPELQSVRVPVQGAAGAVGWEREHFSRSGAVKAGTLGQAVQTERNGSAHRCLRAHFTSDSERLISIVIVQVPGELRGMWGAGAGLSCPDPRQLLVDRTSKAL